MQTIDLCGERFHLIAVAAQDDLDLGSQPRELLGHGHNLPQSLLASEIATVEHLHRGMCPPCGRPDLVRVDPQWHDVDGCRDADLAQLVPHLGGKHHDEIYPV